MKTAIFYQLGSILRVSNQMQQLSHYRISHIASVFPINSLGVWFWPKQIIGIQRDILLFSHCRSNQGSVHTALIKGKRSKPYTQKGLLNSKWDYCFIWFPPFRNVFCLITAHWQIDLHKQHGKPCSCHVCFMLKPLFGLWPIFSVSSGVICLQCVFILVYVF